MRILSGMRSSGRLHIGHLSVLNNWITLQEKHECFFFAADWHALTTMYDDTTALRENTLEMVADWIAAGIDPERSTVFVQSRVLEHAELHLLLSMLTPLSWLERVPTYKDQVQQLGSQGKDINTYGFLGYPLLMSSDILIYRADAVPVGQDQLPHLEFCREVARRFNHLYSPVFPEPKALLSETPVLLGIDGRKMSKSYGNEIALAMTADEVTDRVRMMVTDPARIRKNDPGHPEVCMAHALHAIYSADRLLELEEDCRAGRVGCVACKNELAKVLNTVLEPIRERRAQLLARPRYLNEVLDAGVEKARVAARATMELAHEAMHI